MNRYEIAIKKIKPMAYRFKTSNDVNKVCDYLRRCLLDRVDFDSTNIRVEILDAALIKVAKETGYPIVIGSEIMEKAIRMTYGTRRVFSLKTLPNVLHVICYFDLDRKKLFDKEIMLTIYRGNK